MKTPEVSGLSVADRRSSKNKSFVIAFLSLMLLFSAGYLVYERSENRKVVNQKNNQIDNITAQKSELQSSFDASLTKIESLQNENAAFQSKLTEQNNTIENSKQQIRMLLRKKDISEADLAKAKKMIESLNISISDMQQEVAKLTEENKTLVEEKSRLSSENQNLSSQLQYSNIQNQELEQKVDVASTLNATNINITPIKIRKNGKERSTEVAKRTDKLLLSFDVSNRIIKPGMTDIYVLVVAPDGKAITAGLKPSDMFDTRDQGSKYYTAKIPVELETTKTKNISFAFVPNGEFREGDYKIEIYHNGFLIGEGIKTLRKTGVFI